jgi:hypothetical protein
MDINWEKCGGELDELISRALASSEPIPILMQVPKMVRNGFNFLL